MAVPLAILPSMKSCLTDDDLYNRSISPLTVIVVDEDEDEFEDDIWLRADMTIAAISIEESLNDESHRSNVPPIRRKSRVRFSPRVTVTFIPSHRDYSLAMKERIWTSMEEIRINAVRCQMQMQLDDYEYGDDKSSEGEREFIPLGRLKRSRRMAELPCYV